jgi:serine/threonine-protein kinase HipA
MYTEEERDFLHPICELVQRRSQTLVGLAASASASAFTAEHFQLSWRHRYAFTAMK